MGPYGRGGGPALRFSGDRLAFIACTVIAGVVGETCVQQVDFRISAAPSAVTPLLRIYDGATIQATLALNTDRTLRVYRGDLTTALGSSSMTRSDLFGRSTNPLIFAKASSSASFVTGFCT